MPRNLAPPMTIDVQLADQGHRVRPLPTPPSPLSASPAQPRKIGPSPSRPLPNLPEADVFASEPPPSPPRSAPIESSPPRAALSRAHRRPGPPRLSSLALRSETRLDEERCFARRESSPTTPTLPEPPTPRTAQRNRASKLRRHLGESVQMQLVMRRDGRGKGDLYPSIAVESFDDDSDSLGSSESEGTEPWQVTAAHDHRSASNPNLPAQKWVRERGKQRFTEQNFTKIMNDLRRL